VPAVAKKNSIKATKDKNMFVDFMRVEFKFESWL